MSRNVTRALLVAAAALTINTAANAAYFVRPYLAYDGEVVDGLILNGATSSSQSFSNDFVSLQSEANLADGTVKAYLDMNGPSSSFGVAAGVIGEQIRYFGETGTAVEFNFDFDGTISAYQDLLGGNEPAGDRQILIDAYFAVYDSSVGATWDNWSVGGSNSQFALISQNILLPFSSSDEYFYEDVFNDELGGILNLVSGNSYDIFASYNLIAIAGSDPGYVTMDFLSTGRLGISDDQFTSQSGDFLGFAQTPAVVPEPASWAMLIAGFGLIGAAARRRRQATVLA